MDKAIVFGGSGFIGSHVADELSARGYDVVIFDRKASPYLKETQAMVLGNLLDREAVREVVAGAAAVFHFAGLADIATSASHPWETMQANVMGTCSILEACVASKVRRLVFASSMYVYSGLGSFYRVSKQACEKLIEEYARAFGVDYTILRIGTPYGPRANAFNSIGTMVRQACREKKLTCYGTPDEVREYIHVFDLAEACVGFIEEGPGNRHVIMTGTESVRLEHLTHIIREILNDDLTIEYRPRQSSGHYRLTPYAYKPEKAVKVAPRHYHDLGQGLLEMLYEFGGRASEDMP
ncbi:NAD-dependent epimerase/dehydratase family protein [Desulfoluna spongiiphila]|uniref:NAD-dependent epimerase/dehydratase family protein n=1 Tax=Desulfoluna spongiiphila TaxID=419481 RepID=UPI0012536C08|nr:NAD(P)-dependent oxidoreductase [Desulfoluna spongiiphila]VVS95110.1 nad-dependent epimerase/dehydratase [Desulfoluna spongiiphila]